jgi:hypothetical protein
MGRGGRRGKGEAPPYSFHPTNRPIFKNPASNTTLQTVRAKKYYNYNYKIQKAASEPTSFFTLMTLAADCNSLVSLQRIAADMSTLA